MPVASHGTGRARAVLVFGKGDDAVAIISSVTARACGEPGKDRLSFVGPVHFDGVSAGHLTQVVLPAVDRILEPLGLAQKSFEISVVNIGATGSVDIGLSITGFSADLPVLLALLAAALEADLPEDVVSTGHIASLEGDIVLVRALPAKVSAALGDDSIKCFVYPAFDRDASLERLSPREKERAAEAVANAKTKIKTVPVSDVADLLRAILPDDPIVLASLRRGFFETELPLRAATTAPDRAAHFLADKNEERFWASLERYLLKGEASLAKELLMARVEFHIRKQTYPRQFGWRLRALIHSLPPLTRQLKIVFPLIPMADCIHLSQFSRESDHEDVFYLYSAIFNRRVGDGGAPSETANLPREVQPDAENRSLVDRVLHEIDGSTLAKTIGLPIDSARACYLMDSITVASGEEFNHVISSFYLHLLRHTRPVPTSDSLNAAGADAYALLERAFSGRGGPNQAQAEAREGVNGGVRHVLDIVTDQFKREEQEKHLKMVFRKALDPLDWGARVNFMKAFLARIAHELPDEIRAAPPERYANHYEELVRVYINSLSKVKELFRTL